MSYLKFCDNCGDEISHGNDWKKIKFVGIKGHNLEMKIQVSSDMGMGEFHICRRCALVVAKDGAE